MDITRDSETKVISFIGSSKPITGKVKDILQIGDNITLVVETSTIDIHVDVSTITAWGQLSAAA